MEESAFDAGLGDRVDFDMEREMEIVRPGQEIPKRRTVSHYVTSN